IGTPAYMAPEQAGGNPIDARADVYSFCVALHEGLYGARPFAITPLPGGGFARGPVTAKLDERDAPAALRKLVMRGLVTDPAQRWPAMAPVLEALAQLVGRRRRRLAVALSIATAAALGIGAYLLVAHAPTDACADQAARIASVWGPAQRDATRRALLASNLPYAPQATSAALDSLDHWAQAWRDARLSTCRAGERAVMPDDEARSRATCLDRLLAESIGRIGVLKTASPDVVQRALEIVTLPDASTCTIGQVDPPPRDATSTVLLAGFRDELAQIDTMVARDRHHDALARLRTLGERARQLDYPQIVDEIARRTIEAELATSEFTAASIPRVRDLGERFAARGQDATAAALWLDLIAMKTQAGDFAGLDETASAARVAALRCHDLTRKLRTEFAIGRLYLAAGKVSLAQTICENGLAATEGLHGETAVEGLLCVAACASAAATPELALRDSSRAFSEALALHGAKHPATLSVLRGIASLHDHLAHNVAATLLRESVAAAIAEQSGETSPDYASVLDDLSASYVVSGDKVRARAASDRAASIFASVPDNDARKISSRAIRAYVLQHVGDNAAALAESVQLADYFERTRARTRSRAVVILNLAGQLGAEGCGRTIAYATRALEDMRADLAPTMLIYLEMTRGNCRAQIGQWAETARDLDALWSQIDPSTLAPQERGMIEIVLANALYHVEAPADRVLDLFVRGRKDLDGARDPQELAQFDKLILEVRRWKARKDAAGPKHH
ncbi:MAG: hypothetical protein K8W52_41925, partial [Deltaproteobacteria bacterium]|nr:hypothetical protein [Deltaproteobacteria bacterium]